MNGEANNGMFKFTIGLDATIHGVNALIQFISNMTGVRASDVWRFEVRDHYARSGSGPKERQ